MKRVVCIKTRKNRGISLGNIYAVAKEDENQYKIIDDSGNKFVCYDKDLFDVVISDDCILKTFREVISTIKEGEVWVNLAKRIEMVNGDIQISRVNGNKFDDYFLNFSEICKYKLKK